MTYEEQADQIAALLQERLGIRGRDLDTRLRRAGRLLPRHIHRAGTVLVEAVKLQENPRLARLIDADKVAKSFRTCEDFLQSIDPWERKKDRLISTLSSVAFSLLAVAALVIAFLYWRDMI